MGITRKVRQLGRQVRRLWSMGPDRDADRGARVCRVEQMEPRRMLAFSVLPIHIGAVYLEDASNDTAGDLFEITWTGGAPGTQLTQIVIDTDKDASGGLSAGEAFFDTAPGGKGVDGSSPFQIVSHAGFDVVSVSVADGGTKLVIDLSGFDPGEKLVFRIDVDEQQSALPADQNAIVEGGEFQFSRLTGVFQAPHFYEAQGTDVFLDAYNAKLTGSGLDLANDQWDPPSPWTPPGAQPGIVYTAGAIFQLTQTPLPITIQGTVFEDVDLDNVRDAGEPGLAGVQLSLFRLEGNDYVDTGLRATTDAAGHYEFAAGVEPGTYRVVETQPAGYFSVGAKAGTVGGQTRGAVTDADTLSGLALVGGENSINNDFGEARPASLSGHVYHDADNDGVFDPGEQGIGGAVVRVQYLPQSGPAPAPIEVITAADGSWSVSGLMPGVYQVLEVQPGGDLDGLDAAGTVNGVIVGTPHNRGDSISGVRLASGQSGVDYDFGELLPASISGRVHAERNGDCVWQPGEPLLSGVTIHLLDAQGNIIATTLTDANGEYRFDGLAPGTYGVLEIQPAGYFDGPDHPGSEGGRTVPTDSIVDVHLGSGTQAVHYDFCEALPNSISGRVFVDLDGNVAYDPGEPLLAGVTIQLLDGQGNVVRTTQTDDKGEYLFDDLAPGKYAVRELQPAGYSDGPDFVGSVGGQLLAPDTITGIVLKSDMHGVRYDFSELASASISGYAFQDGPVISLLPGQAVPSAEAVRDGRFTPDDTPLAGVTIELLRDGQVVATTRTDASGYYEFTGLRPGEYTLREVQPAGYLDGIDTAGTLGGVADSRADTIAQIHLRMGDAGQNYNFSEIAVRTDPPPLPPDEPQPPVVPPLTLQPARPELVTVLPGQPFVMPPIQLEGGVGMASDFAWHLSVVDAGRPRRDQDSGATADAAGRPFALVSQQQWKQADLDRGRWNVGDGANGQPFEFFFGREGATPVTGDFNGDGRSEMGVFIDGEWYIDLNGDGRWDEGDVWYKLGGPGDQPVTGDWDGDGKTDIGIFGPQWARDVLAASLDPGLPDAQNLPTATPKNPPPRPEEATNGERLIQRTPDGKVRDDLIDHVFLYGDGSFRPVAGDWNGDGVATIGVFRDGHWRLDTNGNGRVDEGDLEFDFGQAGDVPVVGDWTGDGIDKMGVFRDGVWYLDTDNDHALTERDQVIRKGAAGDVPVVGDWDGDGVDEPGVYQPGVSRPRGT